MSVRRTIEPLTTFVMRLYWRFTRSCTLGVRVVAVDPLGRVVLVRHTYIEGWFLPGGGVERGEGVREAAERELYEETGAVAAAPLVWRGLYTNFATMSGDHIALFRVEGVTPGDHHGDREIAEVLWCDPSAPPAGATPATRRALAREFGDAPPSEVW